MIQGFTILFFLVALTSAVPFSKSNCDLVTNQGCPDGYVCKARDGVNICHLVLKKNNRCNSNAYKDPVTCEAGYVCKPEFVLRPSIARGFNLYCSPI